MSYLVLARKYRPQTFEDVVGQTHVTQTLSNAITADRVAHAILFSGPRGTGKTTIARVLAKILNCEDNRESAKPVPCNQCKSCLEITNGNAVDVFEIDGASNNSVDQIRELRDNVRYMPAHSLYKIYIIDEVHMLSIAAFNALLKTLEEPPSHVKFLFATTESHKLPVTIMSRCQRHDLRRVQLNALMAHMSSLCEQESITITPDSLSVIAREAGGSVRDSLSLLDQVISCSMGTVHHEEVLSILGAVDRTLIFNLSSALLQKDIATVLDMIHDAYTRGRDLKKLYAELTEHFRNLLMVSLGSSSEHIINLPEHEIQNLSSQTQNVGVPYLTSVLDRLFADEQLIKFSSQPRLALEMVFIKIHQIIPPLPIETLIQKLDTLQQQAESLPRAPQVPNQQSNQWQQPSEKIGDKKKAHFQPLNQVNRAPDPACAPSDIKSNGQSAITNMAQGPTKSNTAQPEPQQQDKSVWTLPPDQAWARFLEYFGSKSPSLKPVLAKSDLKKLSEQSIQIWIKDSPFNISRLKDQKSMALVKNAIQAFFGTIPDIDIKTTVDETDSNRLRREKADKLREEAINNPVISQALTVFSGKLDIKLLKGDAS